MLSSRLDARAGGPVRWVSWMAPAVDLKRSLLSIEGGDAAGSGHLGRPRSRIKPHPEFLDTLTGW
jgi:hypothetical protein